MANESEKNAAIVVLASKEKDQMDDFFRERIENTQTTRIITRAGSTSSVQSLKRVGVDKAKSIIILNQASVVSSKEEKELADSRVLKTVMAVIACTSEENAPPILAEFHLDSKRMLAKSIFSNISVIDEHSILAKLMVQTSRISGLAHVYDNLVGFDGCEFYFYKPEVDVSNKTYAEIQFHFAVCSVLGIRKKTGEIFLNPLPDMILELEDEIILIAEDDSAIEFLDTKLIADLPRPSPVLINIKQIERLLIVGWSQKAQTVVAEYCKYLAKGSGIVVVVNKITDSIRNILAEIKMNNPEIDMQLVESKTYDQEQEDQSELNYGIYINPHKDDVFQIDFGDKLITLAEDES